MDNKPVLTEQDIDRLRTHYNVPATITILNAETGLVSYTKTSDTTSGHLWKITTRGAPFQFTVSMFGKEWLTSDENGVLLLTRDKIAGTHYEKLIKHRDSFDSGIWLGAQYVECNADDPDEWMEAYVYHYDRKTWLDCKWDLDLHYMNNVRGFGDPRPDYYPFWRFSQL